MKKAIIVSARVEPKNKHNYTELAQTVEVLEVLKGLSKDYEIVASSEQLVEEIYLTVKKAAPFIKRVYSNVSFENRLALIKQTFEPVLAIAEDEKVREIYSAHLIPAFHPADFLKSKDQILASLGVKKKPSKKNVSKVDSVFADRFEKGLVDLLTFQSPTNVVKMTGLHEKLAGRAFKGKPPKHINFDRCIAEPLKKTKVEDILKQGADFFESRREEYGEEYLKTGKIRKAFFPNGIKLKTENDFYYFHLFNIIATKLGRIAEHWRKGQHEDSWNDIMIYAAMALERVKNEK